MKVDVNMKDNILKRILRNVLEIFINLIGTLKKHKQVWIIAIMLIISILYFVYTLGYTTNWALVITSTRGGRFYRASQAANKTMANFGFVTLIIVMISVGAGSIKRKKYYASNIVLNLLSSVLLFISAILTLYYNSILRGMYQNVSEEEVPAYLYEVHGAGEKSYLVFDLGNVLSGFMIVSSGLVIYLVFYKIKVQKERETLIEKMVAANEH